MARKKQGQWKMMMYSSGRMAGIKEQAEEIVSSRHLSWLWWSLVLLVVVIVELLKTDGGGGGGEGGGGGIAGGGRNCHS